MGYCHSKGIADANLQPVKVAKFHQGLGSPGGYINGGVVMDGDTANAHTDVGVDGNLCNVTAGLGEGHVSADAGICMKFNLSGTGTTGESTWRAQHSSASG